MTGLRSFTDRSGESLAGQIVAAQTLDLLTFPRSTVKTDEPLSNLLARSWTGQEHKPLKTHITISQLFIDTSVGGLWHAQGETSMPYHCTKVVLPPFKIMQSTLVGGDVNYLEVRPSWKPAD